MGEQEVMRDKLQERAEVGIAIIKALAKKHGIDYEENKVALFIKGCEYGTSLFIQSERAYTSRARTQ